MLFEEKNGHLPFTKNLTLAKLNPMYHIKGKKKNELTEAEKRELFAKVKNTQIGVEEVASEEAASESSAEKVVVEVSK